ncbi:hypothetical protein FRB93_011561 [Tulasnella sp. JGI-2019a]|nr:hypothetical protein FRB93_011561 [Tulasnella sp. JGI-2019a]
MFVEACVARWYHGFIILLLFPGICAVAVVAVAQSQQDVQVPVNLANYDWTDPPSVDATGNLIFSSVSGLLRHWPNALYRHGHNIVSATVGVGTLLYHGPTDNCTGHPPTEPDWVSFDPEHSFIFSSRIYTFRVVRPLKVLYFDGSSAANMPTGTIDTQEILSHGELRDGEWSREWARIKEMCEWGKQFGLDGFLRMEFDFEIEICDFTAGMEIISVLDLLPAFQDQGRPKPDCPNETSGSSNITNQSVNEDSSFRSRLIPPKNFPKSPTEISHPKGWVGSQRPWSAVAFSVIDAGNRHNFPGLTSSVILDFTKLVSFFDIKYTSLVDARREQKRGGYRVGNITREEAELARAEIEGMLSTWDIESDWKANRIRWDGVIQTIVERYADRLEYLSMLLREVTDSDNGSRKMNVTETVQRTRWQVLTMLTMYMPATTKPPTRYKGRRMDTKWLGSTMHHCSTMDTAHINLAPLTTPERLLKGAIEAVTKEICRTLGIIWLDAFDIEGKPEVQQKVLMAKWLKEMTSLKEWLGWYAWSDFTQCNPACGLHEMCTSPQWPLDIDSSGQGGDELFRPYCMSKWWGVGV